MSPEVQAALAEIDDEMTRLRALDAAVKRWAKAYLSHEPLDVCGLIERQRELLALAAPQGASA